MVYSAFVAEPAISAESSITSRFGSSSENGSGHGLGVEQDNTISSSSSQETGISLLDGDGASSGSSSPLSEINESELKSVIDQLEQKVTLEEGTGGNQTIPVVQNGASQPPAHSVEYWSVSQGKPRTFLKRYSANKQSRNFRQFNRRGNNQLFGQPSDHRGGLQEPTFFGAPSPPQLNASFLPLPTPQNPAFLNPQFLPNPSPLHVYAQQAPAPGSPVSFIHVFIPPEQSWTPSPQLPPQFMSPIQVGHVAQAPPAYQVPQAPPAYPVPQQQQYIQYYSGTLPQNGYQLPLAPTPPVSYFQGAPLYYQVPQMPVAPFNQVGQPFLNDYSIFGGYERPLEYPPPPPYEDAIMSPPTLPNVEQPGEMEVDSSTNAVEASPQDNPWEPSNFMTPMVSQAATPSSSDTNLSGVGHSAFCDAPDSATSGYSSCTSSPAQPTEIISSEAGEFETNVGNFTNAGSEVGHAHAESRGDRRNGNHSGLERYAMELRALNDAIINGEMQGTNQGLMPSPPQCQLNLFVYPGESALLIYSQEDGNRSVSLYNAKEIPYVANEFDFRAQTSFKEQSGPALNYSYYVPPRTDDNDFFGGQLPIWQVKMLQYFLKYQPHDWKMHGVPETFNMEMFLGRLMDSVGEFHVVSKLRFSCRTCKTAWTSKKGTIVFKFCFNSALKQGWILLRIFGQICMRQECADWTFQNPACYPEEIDRAMMKLSEYIGNQCYGIAVTPSCFDECFKSIRKNGNVGRNNSGAKERERANLPPTPHKREFCQACLNGVCKNLFAKPFPASLKQVS